MTTPETRYCPHCHHPVTAPADRFQKPARCPKCSQVNLFLLPREPLEPLLPKPPLSLNEYIHRGLLLGCCFLAFITLVLLTNSKNNVLVIFLSTHITTKTSNPIATPFTNTISKQATIGNTGLALI